MLCKPRTPASQAASIALLALLSWSWQLAHPAAAAAGEKDFVVYAPGMGASAAQARPYLDRFAALVEQRMGWAAGSAQMRFVEDRQKVGELIEQQRPGFALLPPWTILDLSCRKVPVAPLSAVVGLSSTAAGGGHYHVVVKEGGAHALGELKGKRLGSNHLSDLRFISRVVFDGKLDAEKDFQLRPTSSPLSPFKWVDRGEAEAALVDDAQLASMKTLPFGQALAPIFSSGPMPPFSVVAFEKVVKPAEREALRKALAGLCASADGAPICKEMQVTRFDPVEAKAFQPATARYCHP